MRDKLNCPNCGAAINGCVCQYCGTQFFDFADIDLGNAGYLRIRVQDQILLVKAIPTKLDMQYEYPHMEVTINSGVGLPIRTIPELCINLELHTIPNDNNELLSVCKLEKDG